MWPFRKRTFLPPEYIEWQLHTYAWLMRNFGGYDRFRQTPLVTPTQDCIPELTTAFGGTQNPEQIQALFDRVRILAGMSGWPCLLEPVEADPDSRQPLPAAALLESPSLDQNAFTYLEQDGIATALINYDPAQAKRPAELVTTFARALSHYLLNCAREAPPGGWEIIKLASDLTSVYLGFGIFTANSALRSSQFGTSLASGWRRGRQSYLSETSLLFALALFTRLTQRDPALVKPHLQGHLGTVFDAAIGELHQHERRILDLRSTTALETATNA